MSIISFIIAILSLTRPRHAAYKAQGPLKQDDLRRRREEQQVEIRRQKREENISKRRNFLPSSGADSDEEIGGGVWDPPVSNVHNTALWIIVLIFFMDSSLPMK